MKKVTGFTLIELMITLAIAAVVMGIAVPSFTDMIQNNQRMTLTNRVITDLMAARAEAVKRNQNVVICRSADAATCATSGGWEQGWIIYADANASGTFDTGDVQVKAAQALPDGYTLRTGGNYTNKLTYRSDGSVSQSDSFTICDNDGNDSESRRVRLIVTGRPRTEVGTGTCP